MPQVSAEDLAALRDQHQYSQFYLGVLVPETVHSSQINYVGIPRGEMSIPFNTGAYAADFAFANVVAGMTLWVGSTPNSHDICKLRLRVPYNRTCTPGSAFSTADGGISGTIEVCEHNFLLQDNYYLTIKEEFKLWPKHATADQGGLTVIRYNDYDIQYCGQNRDANRDPIVRMGPPGVAIRDAITGNAVVNFWSNSGAAPGGGAPGAYAWAWRGGNPATAFVPGTADAPHEVTWVNDGNYLATLTLDGTVSGFRPVFIFAPTGSGAPYEDFEVQNLGSDFDTGGWRMSVRVKEDCAEADFPEESMIVLFARDWYKGDEVSIGGNYRHRENIIFLGHITRESVRRDPYTNDVLFEAHTIDGEMKNIEQFPLSVEDDPNANANWGQIQNMTMDKAAYFLMKWQSTLLDITDVHFSGDTKLVRWFDIAQKSFYEQLDQDCYDSAILGRCMSDRMSLVRCDLNPQFIDVGASRDALATIMDIETQDWRNEIEIPSPQSPRCSLVDLSAGSYAGGLADVQLIFSLAHGDVPMERGRSITVDNLIGTDQNQCNRVVGNFLANQNNPYPGISVPIQLNYRVFDITPQEWVTMSLAAADTYRAIEWTEERLIPRVINFNLENAIGALNVDLRLEAESSGTAGVAGYYPTEPPDEPYSPPPTPTPPDYTPGIDEMDGIYVVGMHGSGAFTPGIQRTEDIGAAVPVWAAWNTGIDMGTYPYCRALGRDPWHPKERLYCLMAPLDPDPRNEHGDVLYRREYSGGAWGSWTPILNKAIFDDLVGVIVAGFHLGRFHCNINVDGQINLLGHWQVAPTKWIRHLQSSDYGDTWNLMGVLVAYVDWHPSAVPMSFAVGMLKGTSGFDAGKVMYAGYRDDSAGHYPKFSVTTNGGANWAHVDGGTNTNTKGKRLHVDPNDQSIVYVQQGQSFLTMGDVWKYTNDGAVNAGDQAAWGNVSRVPVCKVEHPNTMHAAASTVLKQSTDGGGIVTSVAVANNIAGCGMVLNWDWNHLRTLASLVNGVGPTAIVFQYSSDGGNIWADKTGNLSTTAYGCVNSGFSLDN